MPTATTLTPEQRAIVEFGDGPAVVIAGAGTGKTRVIVERVAWLLATKPDLAPESLLVLTYNVKAARELRERIEQAVGAATAARVTVANFHSFCHRVLTESGPEVGLPARPDVLDGIGQFLLIRDIRPSLTLVYHSGEWFYGDLVRFINRAKDELVTPDDFDIIFGARGRRLVVPSRHGDPGLTGDGQRTELHRTIWRIANDLRGSVDGWDFKTYVLGLLFYRFISENLTAYLNAHERRLNPTFDYAALADEDAEIARAETVQEKGFFIYPSELFVNVRRQRAPRREPERDAGEGLPRHRGVGGRR